MCGLCGDGPIQNPRRKAAAAMHEEQIGKIMNDVFMLATKDGLIEYEVQRTMKSIRSAIEELVAHPSVTPMWHMIEDKDATYMIANTVAGIAYCKGMDEDEAWKLVRRLNGIEE